MPPLPLDPRPRTALWLLPIALLVACGEAPEQERASGGSPAEAPRIDDVTLTWLSVTNWVLEAGPTTLLFDGYVSRVNRTTVHEDGTSTAPASPDTGWVREVRDALMPADQPDWVFVGHAHWDHALDAPFWAELSGGRVVGARTVCFQAEARGIPQDRCDPVEGGEVIQAGPGVEVRVVRWHHSGDTTVAGRRLRAPVELPATPAVAETGGLRPGYLEDYPNGGGSRAYLISVETRAGPVQVFWSGTGNPLLWDETAQGDSAVLADAGVAFEGLEWATTDVPTRDQLAAVVRDAGIEEVDLWLGFGNSAHVRQVMQVMRPRAFAPQHWDDFWAPITDGVVEPYPGRALPALLDEEGIAFVEPRQFFDRFVVSPTGVRALDGNALRERLGVPPPPVR